MSLTKLEDSDLKEGAKAAKAKIEELFKKHSYFWSTIAPVALLLNPTIEDYGALLTSDLVEKSKNIITNKMRKYPEYSAEVNVHPLSARISNFQKNKDEDEDEKNTGCPVDI